MLPAEAGRIFLQKSDEQMMKNTKTGSKVHLRMQVMLSRAFQNGHFPLARRKLLFFGQYKAEMLFAN